MNGTDQTIEAWTKVSAELRMILEKPENSTFSDQWNNACYKAEAENPWFTQSQILTAMEGISILLEPKQLREFVLNYDLSPVTSAKEVGVIMAGNIPPQDFHDMLCVSLSGNRLSAKLSSSDKTLLPFLHQVLAKIDSEAANRIRFVDNLKSVDAVIATGSDNSARYFEYYFGNKPHIFRKNRNSVAIITGNENEYDLILLGKDIFTYFGLGCRSVSKLFVPQGYSFDTFYEAMLAFQDVMQHSKYMNNHDYHQALFLMNQETFLTNNFLIIKHDDRLSSPVGVLYYEAYDQLPEAIEKTKSINEKIQCVVMKGGATAPGNAQFPGIADYADGVDTMQFLTNLD